MDCEGLNNYQRRKRVAEVLIEPLEAEGMRRKRGVKPDEHEKQMESLKTRLAHLTLPNLNRMRLYITRAAGGKDRDVWPSLVSISNWALDIQAPPDDDNEMVISYMSSAAGRKAWGMGPQYAVALRTYLRRARLVPNAYTWKTINQNGADLERTRERVCEALANHSATEVDREWLAGYEKAVEAVKKLVFKKEVAA